jgi:hypothetical protein
MPALFPGIAIPGRRTKFISADKSTSLNYRLKRFHCCSNEYFLGNSLLGIIPVPD